MPVFPFGGLASLSTYPSRRYVASLWPVNAAAVGAHGASVSVVTFSAAVSILQERGQAFEP